MEDQKKTEGHNPNEDCSPSAALRKKFDDRHARFHRDLGADLRHRLELVGGALAAERLALDLGNRLLGFGDATLAQQVTHRFRHVAPHEKEQHCRHDADCEQSAPAEGRQNGQAEGCRDDQSHWEGGQQISGHGAADATGAEFRAERRRDRHLAAKAEIREETEDREGSDVPGRRNKPGK